MRPAAPVIADLAQLATEPGSDDARPEQKTPTKPAANGGFGGAYFMAAAILFGVGVGYLLDKHYGTSPRWTIALSMVFLVVGVYQTIREANK